MKRVEFTSTFGLEVSWRTSNVRPRFGTLIDLPEGMDWRERQAVLPRKIGIVTAIVPFRSGSWFRTVAAIKAAGGRRVVVWNRINTNPEASPFRAVILVKEVRWAFVPVYKSGFSSFRTLCFDTFAEFAHVPRSKSAGLNTLMDPRTAGADFISFSFARNPLDRFQSFYRDKMLSPEGSANIRNFKEPISLLAGGDCMHSIARFVSAVPDSHSDPHWRSQASTLTFAGESLVNRIYRLENAQRALAELWPGDEPPEFPHVLSSKRRSTQDPSWADAEPLLSQRYAADFEIHEQAG